MTRDWILFRLGELAIRMSRPDFLPEDDEATIAEYSRLREMLFRYWIPR